VSDRNKAPDDNQTGMTVHSEANRYVCYRLCVKRVEVYTLHLKVTHEILTAKKLTREATGRQWHCRGGRKSVGDVSCDWHYRPASDWSSVVVDGDGIEFAALCRSFENCGQSLWAAMAAVTPQSTVSPLPLTVVWCVDISHGTFPSAIFLWILLVKRKRRLK